MAEKLKEEKLKEEKLKEAKLQAAIEEVGRMITLDGHDDTLKKSLLKLVADALSKEQFIAAIKGKMDEILKDKKIDVSDVPNMVDVSIKVNAILPQLLGLTTSIQTAHVKYIVYGAVYYYIEQNRPEFFIENGVSFLDVFRVLFSGMWQLVAAIDPRNVAIQVEEAVDTLCGWCCRVTPVKTSEPVTH